MRKKIAENLLELVKNNYQEIAIEFDKTRQKELWPEIKNFALKINNGDSLLDIGCGNGRLLEALKNKQINYLGVDNSSELIKIAQKNYPNNKFLVGDILNLEQISEKKFDYIFCLAVLPHIPGKELKIQALEELAKHLSDSGTIILSAWNLWNKKGNKKYRSLIVKNILLKIIGLNNLDFGDLIFPWKNIKSEIVSQRYYHAFIEFELKKLIKKTNLKIQEFKKDDFNYWLVLKHKK